MAGKVRNYESDNIDVQYDVKRCIHAAECVRRLSEVFDTDKRPWVQPQNAPADAVAETVQHCPTGALHFERKDGGASEAIPEENMIRIAADGPLYVRGDVEITTIDGDLILEDTRVALCRCGASEHKPFCDNSHKNAGFADPGTPPENEKSDPTAQGESRLSISPALNGPLLLNGEFEIVSADGQAVFLGTKAALCRCGQSANKPFCDGTHARVGFQAE